MIYTFSEVFGPFECEHTDGDNQCKKESWAVILTSDEWEKIKDVDEIYRPGHVLRLGIGVMVCSDHGGC